MVFSSIVFLLYFLPLILAIYFFIDNKFKNPFLLLASIIFYSWGAPKFIFVILFTTVLDFYMVRWMYSQTDTRKRKLLLVFSVLMNTGLLFYFKYCNFFIDNANALLGLLGKRPIGALDVILPIGISFYTFESLTYVIDVYRKKHAPLNNFWDYQLYIILFPKLIAGPIIRYHEIADQINDRFAKYNAGMILTGLRRFAIGLGKKVLIANTVGVMADAIWSLNINDINTTTAWIGMLAYTFQIYFDFSGYSDMAIGIGQMLGFKFPENFNNPYTSGSITEFWRRWHITLGAWMKNYLYIPLGGNQVGTLRLYFNLWMVFLISGFWHGAAWTFIFWGAYHGFWLIIERLGLEKILNRSGRVISAIITFFIVAVGWVFFRSESLGFSLRYIKKLVSFKFNEGAVLTYNSGFWLMFVLAFVFSFFILVPAFKKIQDSIYFGDYSPRRNIIASATVIVIMMLCIGYIGASGFNPFIYFRF